MDTAAAVFFTFNPFRTAVPFWGQSSQISSSFVPKRDCGSKGVKALFLLVDIQLFFFFFFQLVLLFVQVVAASAAGGGTTVSFFYGILSLFLFVSLFHRMRMPCLSCPV